MASNQENVDWVNAYAVHGLCLTATGSNQGTGTCPHCSDDRAHFFVSLETGQWDCKHCGEQGNYNSFLRSRWQKCLSKTKDREYQELSNERGIPVAILEAWGLAKSPGGDWLLPGKDSGKGLNNLFKWSGPGGNLFSSPGCNLHLFTAPKTGSKRHDSAYVYVCEGPWDAMAWQHVLQDCKKVNRQTGGTQDGQSVGGLVVALPGANNCHKELPALCKGKHVRLLLDNDKAGQVGTEKAVKTLKGCGCKSLKVLSWPKGTRDKYDIRDLLKDKGPKEAHQFVKSHLKARNVKSSNGSTDGPDFPIYTFSQLMQAEFEMEYLVENLLCKDHPCGIIGPAKTMKTTLAIDLAISLATGGRFLNYFNCKKCRVLLMTGENGLPTVRETAQRIADAYGWSDSDLDGLAFSSVLPRFKDEDHLEKLSSKIDGLEIQVLIVDPAYLCVDVEGRESSLFAVGKQLARINSLCCEKGVTFVLIHHATQNISPGQKPRLQDSAWAGFEQFFRQWIVVNRKTAYKPGTGRHDLLLSAGGAMGHSSIYRVDIQEGTTDKKGKRFWIPTVVDQREVDQTAQEQLRKLAVREKAEKVKAILADLPGRKETLSALGRLSKLNNENCHRALAYLQDNGTVVVVRARKGRKQEKYYKLLPPERNQDNRDKAL